MRTTDGGRRSAGKTVRVAVVLVCAIAIPIATGFWLYRDVLLLRRVGSDANSGPNADPEREACDLLVADAVIMGRVLSSAGSRQGTDDIEVVKSWKGPPVGSRLKAFWSDDGYGTFQQRPEPQLMPLTAHRQKNFPLRWTVWGLEPYQGWLQPRNLAWASHEAGLIAALDRVTAIAASGKFGVGTLNDACAPLLYRTQYEPGARNGGVEP